MDDKLCLNCMKEQIHDNVCPVCGWYEGKLPDELWHLYPGTSLNERYIIGTVLGFGGFGVTYVAYDTRLSCKVAVKEYFPSDLASRLPGTTEVLMYSGTKKEEYQYGLDGFLEEARNLAKFNLHPNIVSVQDFFKENNTAYIVMEFLDGISLKDYLAMNDEVMDVPTAIEIMNPIIDAIKAVHKEHIIHRDISPDNIYITLNKKVKLLDFGAARHAMSGKSKTMSVILKPGYAPEEQYRTKGKQGEWTDIYALAATFYKAITGITPMESIERIMDDQLLPPSELGIKIDSNVERALMKALAVKSEYRFRSCEEFQEGLLNEKVVTLNNEQDAFHSYYNYKTQKRFSHVTKLSIALIVVCIVTISVLVVVMPNNATAVIAFDDTLTAKIKMAYINEGDNQALPSVVEAYNAYYPNVEIELEFYSEDDISEMVSQGQEPELLIIENTENIDLSEFQYKAKDLLKNNEQLLLNEQLINHYSKYQLLPLGFDKKVVYYNETVLKNNGIDIPNRETWSANQLLSDAKNFSNENIVGILVPYYSLDTLIELQEENLHNLEDYSLLNQEENNKYVSIIEDSFEGNAIGFEGDKNVIASDQAAYYIGNASEYRYFTDHMGGFFGASSLPMVNANGEIVYDTQFRMLTAVSSKLDKSQKEAMNKLLYFMVSEEGQNILHIQNDNYIPINKSVLDLYIETHNALDFIINEVNQARFYQNRWTSIENELKQLRKHFNY